METVSSYLLLQGVVVGVGAGEMFWAQSCQPLFRITLGSRDFLLGCDPSAASVDTGSDDGLTPVLMSDRGYLLLHKVHIRSGLLGVLDCQREVAGRSVPWSLKQIDNVL